MPELIINLVHSTHGQPHQQNISAPYRSLLALTMALVSAWAQLHNSSRAPEGAPIALRGQMRVLPYFFTKSFIITQSDTGQGGPAPSQPTAFAFSSSFNCGQT